MEKTKIRPREIYQRSEEFGLLSSANMLIGIIESDNDNKRRLESIKYLALISDNSTEIKEGSFTIFENLLVSSDQVVIKSEAAKALGRIKHEKGLKPLKWILEQNQINDQIKLSALKAIKEIRFHEPEVELFIHELDDSFKPIRDFVSVQLLGLSPNKLVDLLLDSLKNRSLSNFHKMESIKLLAHKLSGINNIRIKKPEILTNLIFYKKALLSAIIQILSKDDMELMNSAFIILKLLEKEIETDLIRLLLVDDIVVKKNATILIGKLKLKNAVDLLITNLDDIDNEVSIASIESLSEIGDKSVVPELLNILDIEDLNADLDMRLYIADAIKKIYFTNKDASYDCLYSCLNRQNTAIRESVAFILGEIGNDEFVNHLVDLLSVKNVDIQKSTIIALGKIGSVAPLDNLIKILEDRNSYWLIKKVAVDAIFNIFQNNWFKTRGDEKVIRRLLKKNLAMLVSYLGNTAEENYKVKLSLIKLLETYGNEQSLSELLKLVNDFHRVVRIHASNAIKKIQERIDLENTDE
ncbi:hypothetical protein LCGC14_0767230 [marine sediment metagenome]|uniref:Condensin complex subunit 1 C-terminal domain-containing protein n=1 Tax=marine sediment metagenome TaxID=412755 RepID=A0A0F9Q3L2_9ZZZZ|nr:MAG: PBS lyase HEAT-like repeat protein [Candidatus Lokiarchaeum sp. GC14_75]